MIRTSRIQREYKEAGSLNSLIALWGFVEDAVFLTKAGHVGLTYRLDGVDIECLDDSQRRHVVHRFEAGLRALDADCHLYQYLVKTRVAPLTAQPCSHPLVNEAVQARTRAFTQRRASLYDIELYLVLLYGGLAARLAPLRGFNHATYRALTSVAAYAFPSTTSALIDDELTRATAELKQRALAVEAALADTVRPRRLSKQDAFQFFRRLVNDRTASAHEATLKHDTHLDYFVADSPLECHRTHLLLGSTRIKALSMKEPPNATFPQALGALLDVPGEFIACLEWRRIPNDRMRRALRQHRRHFFNKRISMVNYVSPETRPEDMLVDESAGATVRQLGDALTEIDVNNHFFGECSLTLVLLDSDAQRLDQAVAEARKVLASHDGAFAEESYNLLNAWLSLVPGNTACNLRRLPLLETNCADLAFLFTLHTGSAHSAHLDAEALAVLDTRHQAPFHYDLHVHDVGHTAVFGATGSGKSFLLNFLLLHAQKYNPQTIVFDLGHGYRHLAHHLNGGYLQLGVADQRVRLNPFALDPTDENLHFLHAFTRVLLESADSYRLSEAEDRELYEAIQSLYVLDPGQRRLFTLANVLPRSLSTRLSRWVEGGRYASLFDHVEDTFSLREFQVLDFEAMREYPALLEPVLFYVLHRVGTRIADPESSQRLKLCVMDEAWRFIQHETLRDYVQTALKTWRKANASMLLATQAVDDFRSADLLRTVLESCPTKLLLANPAFDRDQYAALFQLNDTERQIVATLTPRHELLLKRPGLSKVLALNVDATHTALFAPPRLT